MSEQQNLQSICEANERRLVAVLERAGWSLRDVDLDFTGEVPRVAIHAIRHDGWRVSACSDGLGRAMVEVFQQETVSVVADRQGSRKFLADAISDRFIGRRRFIGARQMMRGLCEYLCDNALRPILLAEVKSAWGAIMSSRVRIGAS